MEIYDINYINGPWRNDACMGYAVLAMREAGIKEEDQRAVLIALERLFDGVSVEEAAHLGEP